MEMLMVDTIQVLAETATHNKINNYIRMFKWQEDKIVEQGSNLDHAAKWDNKENFIEWNY